MAAWLDEGARQPLGDVEREQQREPLPRAANAAQHARRNEGEREGLQCQPRAVRAERCQRQFPQQLEGGERERAGDRDARDAGGVR